MVNIEAYNSLSQEKFIRLNITDTNEKELNSEYFPHYGEEGHTLAYFRGIENIPLFTKNILPDVKLLIDKNNIGINNTKDSWRLAMNFYENISGVVSGFPFHVDIPANGVVTMIMNIHRAAMFQITNGSDIFDIRLPIGALLLLSGESRYKWKHRILPSKSESNTPNSIERVSLVLGVK